MTSSEQYREAAALLRRGMERVRRGWTQRASARSAEGRQVAPWGKAAVCWCMAGSLAEKAGPWRYEVFVMLAWTAIVEEIEQQKEGPIAWQDHPDRTQAEVLAVMESAATNLEAEAPQ